MPVTRYQRQQVAQGAEHLLPYAKKRIAWMRKRMAELGLRVMRHTVFAEDGAEIHCLIVNGFEVIKINGVSQYYTWAGTAEWSNYFDLDETVLNTLVAVPASSSLTTRAVWGRRINLSYSSFLNTAAGLDVPSLFAGKYALTTTFQNAYEIAETDFNIEVALNITSPVERQYKQTLSSGNRIYVSFAIDEAYPAELGYGIFLLETPYITLHGGQKIPGGGIYPLTFSLTAGSATVTTPIVAFPDTPVLHAQIMSNLVDAARASTHPDFTALTIYYDGGTWATLYRHDSGPAIPISMSISGPASTAGAYVRWNNVPAIYWPSSVFSIEAGATVYGRLDYPVQLVT